MSTPPKIQYSAPVISPDVPWETRRHLQLLYQKLGNHTQAFSLQQQKINSLNPGSTTTNITENGGGSSPAPPSSGFLGQGLINDQSGQTGYATTPGDNGILLILNDPSAIAVSLTTDSAPFYLFITNFGAGTAALTPSTGTINGVASLSLLQNQTVYVSCDSTNWDSTALTGPSPQDTPQITHEWIDSYNASTGFFGQSQPTAADVTNAASVIAANTFTPSQRFTAGITIGTPPVIASLSWGAGIFIIQAILGGTVPLAMGFETLAGNSNVALQSITAELGFGLITTVSGSTYRTIEQVESNPANFLSASNTVEYQFGADKNGTPGTVPPVTLAVGDVNIVAKLPLRALSTVTQPAPSVLTAATTATSATAGGATALPATPAGYLQVSINGTTFKLPYYAV